MTAAERLAAIRARADAATEGPWDSEGEMVGAGDDWLATADHVPDDVQAWRNATFIAAARTDIPRLVAALEAVLAVHHPVPVYALADECECGDRDNHEVIQSEGGDLLCGASPTGEFVCAECGGLDGWGIADPTAHPCPTVRAIETALGGD